MNEIKKMLQSPAFFGFVRIFIVAGATLLAKHGVDIGGYVEPLTAGVILVAVAWWSYASKKPRKIKVVCK
jgi:hypothetical protein